LTGVESESTRPPIALEAAHHEAVATAEVVAIVEAMEEAKEAMEEEDVEAMVDKAVVPHGVLLRADNMLRVVVMAASKVVKAAMADKKARAASSGRAFPIRSTFVRCDLSFNTLIP